jgi:pyruvate decarboxylase
MKVLLPKLAERLKDFREKASQLQVPEFKNTVVTDTDALITHAWLWWRIGAWFQEKDLIVTEAGMLYIESVSFIVLLTSPPAVGSVSYGVLDLALPKDSSLLAQKLWASIGWSPG